MTPEESIDFISNKIQIDVRFCSNDDINKTEAALKLAISALEKQVAKKPTDICTPVVSWGLCPECKGELKKLGGKPNRLFEGTAYCPDCGQALDWSDTE